jgi:predicted TIM-barrel fold metal-dependent hydrolase
MTAVTPPLIDCHAHVWEAGMPFVRTAWTRPAQAYTVENWLADLDVHGVHYGVIAAASLFGTYNDYTIRALRRHDRLRGTAIVDPAIDLYALEAMHADGIVGIRLQWFLLDPLPDMESDDFARLCRRLRDLGMHIHLNIEGARLDAVAGRIAATGVRLVIDHFGWHDPTPQLEAPSYRAMLRLLERDNVWVKLTAGFRHPTQKLPDWTLQAAYTQDLLTRLGPDKLLWGSDAPFVGHEDAATYATALDMWSACIPESARTAIGQNGYRLYFGDLTYGRGSKWPIATRSPRTARAKPRARRAASWRSAWCSASSSSWPGAIPQA